METQVHDAVFVFGDVHGERAQVERLIQMARAQCPDVDVALYSTGDAIDRGPDSKGVVDLFFTEGVRMVLGNHELWMHQYMATGVFQPYALEGIMGGKDTLFSYGLDVQGMPMDYDIDIRDVPAEIQKRLKKHIPREHTEYLLAQPLLRKFRVGDQLYRLAHTAIHGTTFGELWNEPMPAGMSEEDRVDTMLSTVATLWPDRLTWQKARKRQIVPLPDGSVQLFGHTPWGRAEVADHYIALDTGCGTCAPYKLSGVLLRKGQEPRVLSTL